jgi:zinc protease
MKSFEETITGAGRAALMVAFLLSVPSGAATASPATTDNAVSEFFLDNGLQVVVIPDRRAPVVTHMLWYKVGSADEDAGKSGIAHFLEHLMFKGTETHAAGEFSQEIAAIGGRENAFTSYDYTAYFQQVTPDALETMMRFEADRMRNLVLTDEVVAPERDVVIEERRSRVESEPSGILGEELDATLFQNHPYRVPVIGWMHEIEKLNREDAIDFYNQYYAPNNAVLIVAGDVSADEVEAMARAAYGDLPRSETLPPRIRPREPQQKTQRAVTLTDPRVGRPSFRKAWVTPSYTTAAPGEGEALDLLAEILGGGTRSRAYEELVVKQGIAASVGAFYRSGALDDTTFQVYGSPRGEATLEQIEQVMDAEIERIATDGVTDTELAAAKKRLVRSLVFARDNQSGMARIYGATLTTGGTLDDIARWPERIEAVTSDAIRDAARRHLDQRRAVTGYLLPQTEERS